MNKVYNAGLAGGGTARTRAGDAGRVVQGLEQDEARARTQQAPIHVCGGW